ncbi:NAD(P)/FAD-dependent oxidoreductase [Protaetiibacter larvae]|uniref:NAD(P)/FAD-dependent oxidoreductase n=1 Tax=Protaetiibacter larvae TaxID=2592654 RepID=UPI00143D1420|nr:FAD-dependent oxidoreductase [Protaetiibacter larvae]
MSPISSGLQVAGELSVVIVGGGYAGMIAANRLRGSLTPAEVARVRVTIVNPIDRFVHRIRLHEFAGGGDDPTYDFPSMVGESVGIVVGRVVRIDAARRRLAIATASGPRELGYDRLVYAVGSRPALRVPGVAEHALTIGELGGAARVRARLTDGAREIVVVGGGPTGIEVAAELAESYPRARVTMLTGAVARGMRPAARRRIARGLRRLGVDILEDARVVRVHPGGAELADGRFLRADATVWAAEFEVPALAADSGLPVDETGRLLVDETLACIADPAIVGAGDAVRVPASVGAHLSMGARTALPLGLAAAERILAELRGTAPQPISIGLLGPSISLGRKDGYIQLTRHDDSPTPIAFTGRLGAAIKDWVCRMTIDSPREELTRPGAYRVPRGPRSQAAG